MSAPAYVYRVGYIVKTWFDTGGGKGGGPQILFGVVKSAGPKTALIEWESGLRNRVRHGDHRVQIAQPLEHHKAQP